MNSRIFGLVPLALVATALMGTGCHNNKRKPRSCSQRPLIIKPAIQEYEEEEEEVFVEKRCSEEKKVEECKTCKPAVIEPLHSCEEMCDYVNFNDDRISSIYTKNVRGHHQARSTPFTHSGGLLLTGDFLYYQTRQDNMEYTTQCDTLPNNETRLQHKEINWNWEYGFRVGLGFHFHGDNWDTQFRYTWLEVSESNSRKTANANRFFLPTWSEPLIGSRTKDARGRWKLGYNLLDWELARNAFVSKNLTIRPHFGARGASIEQKITSEYTNVDFADPVIAGAFIASAENTTYRGQNEWWGVGPRAGVDAIYHFWKHFGLFGKVSVSLLTGRFEIKEVTNGFEVDQMQALVAGRIKATESFHKLRANVEAQIGFEWTHIFKKGAYMNILIGYDASKWFDQNQLTQTALRSGGHLGLHGGSARLELKF